MSNTVYTSSDAAQKAFFNALVLTAAASKKELKKLVISNFGGCVKNAMGLTPPMWASFARASDSGEAGVTVDYEKGRRASDKTIARDIKKATWTLREKNKFKNSDIDSRGMSTVNAYLACRNSRKRYAGGFGRPISEQDKGLLERFLKNRQGWVPAGWMTAAKQFGVRGVPSWITRFAKKAKGSARYDEGEHHFYCEAVNDTKHENASTIQSRIYIAVKMQARVMERAVWSKISSTMKGFFSMM